MSKVEIESFLKSFVLFFSSLGILIATLFYINYTKEIQTLDESIFSQMRLCSYDLQCEQFNIDFIPMNGQKLYTLYKDETGLTSYYPIPQSSKNIMLFHFSTKQYDAEVQNIKNQELWKFALVLVIVFVLSIVFSVYALYPLRNALILTQEFIKDILHDFNTPLASLRLNSAMLKREIGKNEKINRIEQSVENILSLQEHLRSYLHNHTMQKEKFELQHILVNQIKLLEKNYPNITFTSNINHVTLLTNKEAFVRIIDNLLSNAAKYNKPKGSVVVNFNPDSSDLYIIDTGKGIKNPKLIFDRFYKEQERGIGIGLHIVKKLCEELDVKISVKSVLKEGTTFTLGLSRLTQD
ncbi:HAMP domain-containing histidine kinase [bacterium]|nr:HAMP domain-containing histidine kinase [bacterium]MBU1989578.1 HAMP domain-containing histidine kinase [bacterium]